MPPPHPYSSRTGHWEGTQTVLVVANLAWTTLCLGGYLPQTVVVTSALNGLLLAVHLLGRAWIPDQLPERHPAGRWLLPFLIYGACNAAFVTPVPWLGWGDWLGWAQMIAVFCVVLDGVRSPRPRAVLWGAILAVAAVAVALACYQRFGDPQWLMLGRHQANQFVGRASGCFGIPNSLAGLLLLVAPATAAAACRRGAGPVSRAFSGGLTAFFAFGLFLTISRGGWLALGLALVAWPLFGSHRRPAARVGVAVAVLAAVAAGVAVLYFAAPKVRERLDAVARDAGERTRPIMWRGAWQIFREHPAWGGGAGSYNVLFEKFRPERYQDEPQWAHNDYLNTLADYGTVGFVLFFGACGMIAWRGARGGAKLPNSAAPVIAPSVALGDAAPPGSVPLDDPRFRQGLAVGVLAFALQLFVDFHLKLPALAMAFAICGALLLSGSWRAGTAAPRRFAARWTYGAATLATLAGAWFFVLPHYRAEALRYAARESIDRQARTDANAAERRATGARARADFARAVAIDPRNAQAWADLSYAISLRIYEEPAALIASGRTAEGVAQTAKLGREAEAAARRALTLTTALPEAWVRLGVALDMEDRWVEAGQPFVEALALAPAAVNIRFYHAYHLAQRPFTRELAQAAVEACLRLDPAHRPAQLLRQQLAISQNTR